MWSWLLLGSNGKLNALGVVSSELVRCMSRGIYYLNKMAFIPILIALVFSFRSSDCIEILREVKAMVCAGMDRNPGNGCWVSSAFNRVTSLKSLACSC